MNSRPDSSFEWTTCCMSAGKCHESDVARSPSVYSNTACSSASILGKPHFTRPIWTNNRRSIRVHYYFSPNTTMHIRQLWQPMVWMLIVKRGKEGEYKLQPWLLCCMYGTSKRSYWSYWCEQNDSLNVVWLRFNDKVSNLSHPIIQGLAHSCCVISHPACNASIVNML